MLAQPGEIMSGRRGVYSLRAREATPEGVNRL